MTNVLIHFSFPIEDDYNPGYEENPIDSKMDEIKQRLRAKVGDYGTSNGMTIQDRVKAKLSQIGVK